MERIGIAASRMAHGNIFFYNIYVVLISFLFSFLIFVLSGATVFFTMVVLSYLEDELKFFRLGKDFSSIFSVCMVSLAIIMVLFNLVAISKNVKLQKHH